MCIHLRTDTIAQPLQSESSNLRQTRTTIRLEVAPNKGEAIFRGADLLSQSGIELWASATF